MAMAEESAWTRREGLLTAFTATHFGLGQNMNAVSRLPAGVTGVLKVSTSLPWHHTIPRLRSLYNARGTL